jgi:hypothetical protein
LRNARSNWAAYSELRVELLGVLAGGRVRRLRLVDPGEQLGVLSLEQVELAVDRLREAAPAEDHGTSSR